MAGTPRFMIVQLSFAYLWVQANCWFFVSLLQQHLGAAGDGTFTFGVLPNPTLAQQIREEINAELNLLYHFPQSPNVRCLHLFAYGVFT